MHPRLRRFIAAVGVLAFLAFYVWAAIAIGDRIPKHPLIQLLYFGIVGTAWGVPLYPLFKWSEKA